MISAASLPVLSGYASRKASATRVCSSSSQLNSYPQMQVMSSQPGPTSASGCVDGGYALEGESRRMWPLRVENHLGRVECG